MSIDELKSSTFQMGVKIPKKYYCAYCEIEMKEISPGIYKCKSCKSITNQGD
ncbi:hypothetical protein J4460_08315 [Candidatus Woesearchaeota archaeon]|nr:hypothetical protein [Candidatus Woesearchaeota archaeon]HIH37963.1 hypothetical protein [Candidatus Woesearchaeota archaeon]HIH48657.1 hypothetical protein [Candidatus Woesearchaeota archaeon]HIJ03742.1 hypothetical protein [Candidatus Woesearchaeota archaeon]